MTTGHKPPAKPPGWRQGALGEPVAEFLGTAILILFGTGSVAMSVAALNRSDRGAEAFQASGDWLLIAFGWGLGVAFAVWVAGGVSGAHLNAAVTLAQALRRGFPWRKVPTYCAAQVLGAFVGAAIIYLNYHEAITSLESSQQIVRGSADSAATAGIFVTTPAPYFESAIGPLVDQLIGTALLVALAFAVIDETTGRSTASCGSRSWARCSAA